tara:strand:+ start:1596 stop:2417 length:822 start_codon:yes stop_codon:yes gene_type:complete
MTIKQNGGVFGRNPTFNDVTIEGELTFDGDIDIGSDLKINGDLEVLGLSTFNSGADNKIADFISTDAGAFLYIQDSNALGYYHGASNGSYVIRDTDNNTRLSIDSSGNVSVGAGNLAFASGKGIDFSATAGTGTSELLDDYEEGVWTPTYSPASGAFTSVTYNTNTYGRYTRIGRMVSIQGIIITDAITVGTAAGNIRIAGLPFSREKDAAVGVGYGANFNVNNPSGGYVSGSVLFLTYRATSNGATSISTVPDLSVVGTFQNYLIFSTTYVV